MTEEELSRIETELAGYQRTIAQQGTMQTLEAATPQADIGMVKEQISLNDVYDLIDHLLEGETLIRDTSTGNRTWKAPEDQDMILLSEKGINYCRKRLAWHVNKNTLMSNYTEDEIREIVKTFSLSMQEELFLNAKEFFRQPTLKKCYEVLKTRIEDKATLKKYAAELLGMPVDEKKITDEIKKDMENKLEKELENIKIQLIRNKERQFESLCFDIEAIVWTTYNRALRGEERGSIRRHQQSLEVKGGGFNPDAQQAVKPGLISSMFKK